MSEPFGFKVLKRSDGNYEVNLPHCCDEWLISWRATREEAIDDLSRFIKEAQGALNRLVAGELDEY